MLFARAKHDQVVGRLPGGAEQHTRNLVTRLERRDFVRRETDSVDGRFTNAILNEPGFQALADAAPGHVAYVRSLVIDAPSAEQLRRLGREADRIVSRIDTRAIN